MAFGDDPLRKAMRDIAGASDIAKAVRGLGGHSNLIAKAMDEKRRFDEMMAIKPDILEQLTRERLRFNELIAARPTIFEEMARRQSEFDKLMASGSWTETTARLASYQKALAGAERLGELLPKADVYERMLGARAVIPDAVVDLLARGGSLTPVLERIGSAGALEQSIAKQLAGLNDLVAGGHAASMLDRAALSASFPDLAPAFRLPSAAEIAGVDLAAIAGIRDSAAEWARATAAQMAAYEVPWVRDDQPEVSIAGLAAFKGMVEVVARTAPAAPRNAQLVRAELGDYRREDEVDEAIDDPMLASSLRIGRGFDLRLSSLPMALVGNIFVPFGMVVGTAPQADPEELDAVISLMFRQLERKLRAFIDASMKAGVGERWIGQRVHKDIREEWERRRQIDIDRDRTPGEVFDYADFGDYRTIIEKGENWRDVFQPIFKVRTAIGETLGRLSVIRNPVAHVRPLTVEDLLVLRVEGRRLYVWMGEIVP